MGPKIKLLLLERKDLLTQSNYTINSIIFLIWGIWCCLISCFSLLANHNLLIISQALWKWAHAKPSVTGFSTGASFCMLFQRKLALATQKGCRYVASTWKDTSLLNKWNVVIGLQQWTGLLQNGSTVGHFGRVQSLHVVNADCLAFVVSSIGHVPQQHKREGRKCLFINGRRRQAQELGGSVLIRQLHCGCTELAILWAELRFILLLLFCLLKGKFTQTWFHPNLKKKMLRKSMVTGF